MPSTPYRTRHRALGDWARLGYLEFLDGILDRHRSDGAVEALIELSSTAQPKELYAVLDALFAEAGRDPYIAEVLRDVYRSFLVWTEGVLSDALPDADLVARRQVAFAILSWGWAETGFDTIGFRPSRRGDYRALTARLIDTLR